MIATGCPNFYHADKPVPATGASGPSQQIAYFEHTFQLTWNGADLAALEKLIIRHPSGVNVFQTDDSRALSIIVPVFVQKDEHAQLANQLKLDFLRLSKINGASPEIVFPTRECTEPNAGQRADAGIRGMCVRKMTVLLPANRLIHLDLSWNGAAFIQGIRTSLLTLNLPEIGIARLLDIGGNVTVYGGGPTAQLLADGIAPVEDAAGDFSAELTSVRNLQLWRVSGAVRIGITNPTENTAVLLDGKPITEFPYPRPDIRPGK
jgi:hypothetical protein